MKDFSIYLLKKVEKGGGLWGKMINFAPELILILKYACVF